MPGLITIAFTETELHMLSAELCRAVEDTPGNVRRGPLTDAAFVTGTLKLMRAESGPEAKQNRVLRLPPWAMAAVIAVMVPSGVEFPKPTPAKVRTPKRRKAKRVRPAPRPHTIGTTHTRAEVDALLDDGAPAAAEARQ